VGERDRDQSDGHRADHGHEQGRLAVENRGHHEDEDEREAESKSGERKRSAPARECQHHHREQAGEDQHRAATLEVVERVAGARHRLGAGRRLGSLRHADRVARVHVRVEPAATELDLDPLPLVATAVEPGRDQLALLAGEPGANGLLHAIDRRRLGVHRDPLRQLGLDLAGPEEDQADDRRDRERRGHEAE
jgi:hypothetical protein